MTNIELLEKLKEQFPLAVISNKDTFDIKDIRLLDNTEELLEEVVYFGQAEQLKKCKVNGSQLIICDKSNKINKETSSWSNFSTIDEELLFSAFNYAKDLLLEDLEIESSFSEIISMVLNGRATNDIINTIGQKLNNSIVVFDLSYKILAYSDKLQVDNVNWNKVISQGYCSYEFITAIQKLNDVKKSPSDSTSFNVTCEFDPMKKLCSKIIKNGRLIGFVMMFENKTRISKKHHKFLPLISLAVCETLVRDQSFEILKGSIHENIIYDIIDGADKAYMEKRILSLKLSFPKKMCVLAISTSVLVGAKYIKGFLKDELKRIIPRSYSIYYEDFIIMLTPVDSDFLSEKIITNLREFAKKESLKIGISFSFSNILELNTYYVQAHCAMVLTHQIESDDTIHTYEKTWFYHLINNTGQKKTPLVDYCHPALKKLHDYDLKNSTDLFLTLWVYLKCDCVAKKTAEELFIHRNSLSYRIERIFEICNIEELNFELKHALVSSYLIFNYLGKIS